jgi:hypothetical protein
MIQVSGRRRVPSDTPEDPLAEFIYQLCTDEPEYELLSDLSRVLMLCHSSTVCVSHYIFDNASSTFQLLQGQFPDFPHLHYVGGYHQKHFPADRVVQFA